MSRVPVMRNAPQALLAMVVALVALATTSPALAARSSATRPRRIPPGDITTFDVGHRLPGKSVFNAVATMPVTTGALAPGPGVVWTTATATPTDAGGSALRVDTGTGAAEVVDQPGPPGLIVGDRGLWVMARCEKELRLLDRDTLEVLQVVAIPLTNCGPFEPSVHLATRGDAVWVLAGRSLTHVDTATGDVSTLDVPHGEGGGRSFSLPASLEVDDEGVWVTHDMDVWHVDEATLTVDRELPQAPVTCTPHSTPSPGSESCTPAILSVARSGAALWITTVEMTGFANAPEFEFAATRVVGGPPVRVRGIAQLLSDGDALWAVRYPRRGLSTFDPSHPDVTAQLCQVDPVAVRPKRCADFVVSAADGAQIAAGDGALWLGVGSQLTRIAAR